MHGICRPSSGSDVRALPAALLAALLTAPLAATAPAFAATHTVTIEGMRFVPETLTVQRGDEVVWVNRDLVPHTATGPGFDSRSIAAGARWTMRATKPGTHPYVCTFHPTMKATLVVR